MPYILLEDSDQYIIANILETHKNNLVVEHAGTSMRKKAKLEQQLFILNSCTDMNTYLTEITAISKKLDLELILDLLEEEVLFNLDELVELYFGNNKSEKERIALLFSLNNHIAFYNQGHGVFRKCTIEEINERQTKINNSIAEAKLLTQYTQSLINNQIPNWQNIDILKLLNKPDKNSIEHRALTDASKKLNISPLEICVNVVLISDIANYFTQTFLKENFPHGINLNHQDIYTALQHTNLEHNSN